MTPDQEPEVKVFVGNIPETAPVDIEIVHDQPLEPELKGPFTLVRVKYGGRWKS